MSELRLDPEQLEQLQEAVVDAWGKWDRHPGDPHTTKALEDAVAGGGAGLRLLALEGVTPLEGGVLIQTGGRIIGAIGVSGVLSSQDAQVARAGADAAAR